jgi:CDP-diacylglycerol--serine O-phosphatidyltransferase
MIGVYDYTVILTYLSTILAMAGMFLAFSGKETAAVLLLVACGMIDLVDGPVARTKKNRKEDEKSFGIQIDSLNDLISFGVLPAVIGFMVRPGLSPEKIVFLLFPLCGLVRLAWFNVQEANRQKETDEKRKYYTGVPITTSSIVIPTYFILFRNLLPETVYYILFVVVFAVLGFLFVSKLRIPKPQKRGLIILLAIGGGTVIFLVVRMIVMHFIH